LSPGKSRKKSSILQGIFKSGNKRSSDFLILYWRKKPASEEARQLSSKSLFTIVGKRALSQAQERNRAKRLIREIYRKWQAKEKRECYLAVRLIKRPPRLTYKTFQENLEPLLKKIAP